MMQSNQFDQLRTKPPWPNKFSEFVNMFTMNS
jgi:hypothetical protein